MVSILSDIGSILGLLSIISSISSSAISVFIRIRTSRPPSFAIHSTGAVVSLSLVTVKVTDRGIGIEDIDRARMPLYTSKPEYDRSGMGFTVMESFCDKVKVFSKEGKGTTVTLFKRLEGR